MIQTSIQTPRGQLITTSNRQGKVNARLIWDKEFAQNWGGRYSFAQQWLDTQVLRLSDPLVPFDTGMLRKSGQLGTIVGSGMVEYLAPYARRQYYRPKQAEHEAGTSRGPFWFERMKQIHRTHLIETAKRLAGRKKV
jgi:hypothetical protein